MSEIITVEANVHNGKPITRIEVSPNEKYLVTYSDDDDSIAGWNIIEGPEPDNSYLKINDRIKIKQICVSDYKKLAYIYIYQEWHCLSK